jgi:Kef-type K+ transport system membrane component KefB
MLLGLSPLLANIMMGATLANLRVYSNRSFSAVNDFVPIFYILFFTLAGASLDVKILYSVGLIGIFYILARGLGKILGAFIGAKMVHADKNIQKYLGFALLPQGGISIGLSVIVMQELPIYATLITTIIMASVLIYETFGPLFANISIEKSGEINKIPEFTE